MRSNLDNIMEMNAEEHLNVLINLSEEIFHDFKNTLATISGLSQVTACYAVPPEVKENLERIKEASLECRDQIDRFYSFVKGYNVDTMQYEVLSNIVFSALDMVKHRLHKFDKANSGIALNVNIQSVKKVYCNEYKMRQAILNIIMNAIDAIEETGRSGILKLNLYDNMAIKEVVLEVIDTGVGIPEDKLERIFEANYTTKGKKGTGLGLKVSKNVFEACGGRIEVASKVGEGSKFTIYLPTESC